MNISDNGQAMPAILPFEFEKHSVRVLENAGGEVWFVLSDVCRILEITNVGNAAARLDTDEKSNIRNPDVTSAGGNPNITIINESGLYSLVLTSRKAAAKRFKKWVTAEVLPSIRKTGQYGGASLDLEDPTFLRATLLDYTDKVIALQEEVKELAPKAQGLDKIAAWSEGTLCVTDAAKALQMQRKDLFAWLQSHRWLYRRAGNAHWVGYQDKIQQGLVEMKVGEIIKPNGDSKITENVRITPKGLAKLSAIHANQEGV